ncbi:MAG: type II toxin-antitoxin system RelE/ParE family toxin [Kiritimatiellae bacterium]|jgi:toxin ParE1/3/4|nr:type II toxin-antitoxin system RelE/ParE family toxin [Kiritimatiellia bacterium]
MKPYYTQRARFEIELTVSWYEQQQRGLGLRFLDAVENTIDQISNHPLLYMVIYKKFRRCLLRKFPFSVFYTIENELIIIHSIFDNRQDPRKRP